MTLTLDGIHARIVNMSVDTFGNPFFTLLVQRSRVKTVYLFNLDLSRGHVSAWRRGKRSQKNIYYN